MEQREVEGTVRARHRKKAEGSVIVQVKLIQDCPNLSAEGKKRWNSVREVLQKLPVSTEADILAIQRLTETYAEVMDLQDTIRKEGRFYEADTKFGMMIRPHPAVAMYSDASKRLHALLVEFGLTPSSRSKVKAPGDGNPQDPLKEFL